jgi:hypothetical protein
MSYNVSAGKNLTKRMPQYIAGAAASGGAFVMGTALGIKKSFYFINFFSFSCDGTQFFTLNFILFLKDGHLLLVLE